MGKSIIIKKRIIEALENLWLPAPEVSMDRFFEFLYERSEKLSRKPSDQEWLELISSYTAADLKEWVEDRKATERRIHEANERYFELMKKREAKGTGTIRPKRGLDALLPR